MLAAVQRSDRDAPTRSCSRTTTRACSCRAVIERGASRWRASASVPVVVDPKYRNFFRYRGATIFKPNRRELEAALGAAVDLEHPGDAAGDARAASAWNTSCSRLASAAWCSSRRDGEIARVPTTAREVYDVVGAGDTVTAYLAAMLAAGGTPAEAAVIANFAAGIEVGKLGAATVTTTEVESYVADHGVPR